MKKVLLILLLLPNVLLFSQNGFETNLGLSLCYSSVNKSSYGAKDLHGGVGYGLNLRESYFFNDYIGIQTGIDLLKLLVDFDANIGKVPGLHSYTIPFRHEVNFLEMNIPINLSLRTRKINSFRFGISGGLRFRHIIRAQTYVFNNSEEHNGKAKFRIYNSFFENQNLALNLNYFKTPKRIYSLSFKVEKTIYFYNGLENNLYTDVLITNKIYSISIGLLFD